MDLSQQELPLTAYFTRGTKEARSRAATHKRDQPTEDLQSAARSSKRRRSNPQCSTAIPLGSSAGKSEPLLTTLQLPTPATSARKRMRGGRLGELPGKTQLSSTGVLLSPAEQNSEIGIATPRTSSRRVVKPVHGIDDYSPLARSNCPLRPKSSQVSQRSPDSGVSHAALPHVQFPARSSPGLPFPPVDLGRSDPFHARTKASIFLPGDGASALHKQSKTLDGQSFEGHVIPMIPVPSSQSQYLLHLDATPKRKRCFREIELVISSQTQEERELTLSMSHKPAAVVFSSGKHAQCRNAQIPRFSCSERESQHAYKLGRTTVGSPINSSAGPSRSVATKKASEELSPESSSPLRRKILTPCHSPSRKTKTPRRSARQDSIENIPPAHIEDSLTEPESDSDIIQVPRHSPFPRDACPSVRRGFAQGNLPEDDSATEAESDTEILHCITEIGKHQPREHGSKASREDTPLVISPLVSPTRPRVTAMPSTTQFSVREGVGLDVPGSRASYPSTMEQFQARSESLPSVVRNFIRMFSGDESYPADFPESLRI